jgi:hypothetical protein
VETPNDYPLFRCVVLHTSRDADMRRLVAMAPFWRVSGPKTIARAVSWLIANPDEPLTRVPERIAAYVTAARS